MDSSTKLERVMRSIPSHYTSRVTAFRALYAKGEFTLDLFTVDRLLQQNDHELCVEVVCLMLDYLNNPNREQDYPAGCAASYEAIIARMGINQGDIEINSMYLTPLLALLPDGGMTASGYPCRKELADMVYILRRRKDWTSEEFSDAMTGTTWQTHYTNLSELYALNYSSDIRIENLHYGKLFEMLFYRPEEQDTPQVDNDKVDETEPGSDSVETEADAGADADADADADEDNEDGQNGQDADEDNEDEDEEEVEITDPISEDITNYNNEESLDSFLKWIGFKNPETTRDLMLSNQESQISLFLGMSYYHAVSAVLSVVMSLVQKQQRHLNFKVIYMFHEWFFAKKFPVPQIILDYEAPLLVDISDNRASQIYMLSYEKRLREMGQLDPNQPEHDIGVTKRVQNLPFWSETRLMFITSMMEASIFNGGTHLNAPRGYSQWLDARKEELATAQAEMEAADEPEEFEENVEHLNSLVEVADRFFALQDRFHEAMYTHFNTKFSNYTCIIVAWIIAVVEGDESSRAIIEKYFGVNMETWKEYDAELYYSSLQASSPGSVEDCGLDFTWSTTDFCAELEQARVLLYNLSKPCSDYDDLLYCILAQLTMIDHVEGIDWVMEQCENKTSLQDVTNTVIYGRLSLFAFANQLDECDAMDTTKALVKRKAKVVVNSQFSETSNIFLSTICSPHLSDDQVLEIIQYWHGFVKRNPKSNQMHISLFELYSILNRVWAMRYSRAIRTSSLEFFAKNVIPATTIEQLVSSPEPNFLQALFGSFSAQSSYCDDSPSGNTASRYGDFACIAYEQALLGQIYTIVFPTPNHMGKALTIVSSPTILLTPMFLHQSKPAFDHILFTLKFPVRLEIVALMINAMMPCMDWSSCVDIKSIVLQYQQFMFQQQNKPKKKAKKGGKKGTKGKKAAAAAAPTEEETAPEGDVPIKTPPEDNFTMDKAFPPSPDTEFIQYVNSTMLSSLRQLEMNATVQFNTMVDPALKDDPLAQKQYLHKFNTSIAETYGEVVLSPGSHHSTDIKTLQEAVGIKDENKHSVSFFNKDVVQVDNASFNSFNNQILAGYKPMLMATHSDSEELSKTELNELSDDYDSLLNTIMTQHSRITIADSDKYSDLVLDTTVLDALIWFVDKNEKIISEDYGGFELSYGFFLYSLAALLTLFHQVSNSTVSTNDDDEESPSHQLAKLYIALITTMATPQGSILAQVFQLLFTPSHPFPLAYQQCFSRVLSEQLRHFYSPWVHSLYFRAGNIRTMGHLALDLERLVQDSPQGQKLFKTENTKIEAKLRWDTEGLQVDYLPTALFQITLTAIMSECLSQSYMLAFQQHYPQRTTYTKSLMRAQQMREEQPSPYWTHTHKFQGLAGSLVAMADLFKQLSFIPQHITYIIGLLAGLDVTTTIVANPDMDNIQRVWKFYAHERLKLNPENPQLSFLAHGNHQSWFIDIMDSILSRSQLSQNNLKLLETAALLPKDQSLTTTAFNPILNSVINYSQLCTPISQVNEILSMDYWAQITHTFGSLVGRINDFFLLAADAQTQRDDPETLAHFDAKSHFSIITADPVYANGIVTLYNKYIGKPQGKEIEPQVFIAALGAQLQALTNAVGAQDEQVELALTSLTDEQLLNWKVENVIQGVEQEKPKPKVVEAKPISMPISKMMPSTASSIANPKKSSSAAALAPATLTAETTTNTTTAAAAEEATTEEKTEQVQEVVPVDHSQLTQVHSEQVTKTEQGGSALGTVFAVGAVAGLVGAAIYAGLTYLQGKTPSTEGRSDESSQ